VTRIVRQSMSRRQVIKAGAALGAVAAIAPHDRTSWAQDSDPAAALPLNTRAIPSTGERLPVVGLGTNAYSVSAPEDLQSRREVLEALPGLGGRVVDTARAYGESEVVIGRLLEEIGNREELFLATKTPIRGDVSQGDAVVEESFRRLRTDTIDLMQIHNLHGLETLMPVLRAWKEKGRIRYIGVTTSSDDQYEAMLQAMRQHPLDFIQVDYSIANRGAAEKILPFAQERGIAVLLNMPFGGRRGGNLFARLEGKPLPGWAADIGVTSWAGFMLKYVVSHPAATCAIPGTTRLSHLQDNLRAARGRLPDAGMRRKMERYWDSHIA